ncbi:MAG: dTDP-4-dehydrorhamnose reductase [Balneolaceae bacterium]|nr:dTDP-4-dehydrorhamnose reductase [Balneolaceae bacterium]
MTFLILGAGGQLGREWQHYLEKRDEPFNAYDSSDIDIANYLALQKTVENDQPDVVVNCAAYTNVDRAEEERARALEVNAEAAGQLARICQAGGATLVHYSTDYVFPGREKDRTRHPEGYPEDHEASPINWYGETKWRGEQAVRASGADHLIIRTSWLCGQYGANFVTKMMERSEQKQPIKVVNDQFGCPSFAENVVANSYNLVDRKRSGTYHVTSDGILTWFELAQTLFGMLDSKVSLEAVPSDAFPTKADRPAFSKLSIEKLRQVPGAEIWDWQFGLKKLIHKLKKN